MPGRTEADAHRDWGFGHLGLMGVGAAVILGFRHAPDAPALAYLWNVLLMAPTPPSIW